jgi:hypothetical protein
MKRPRHYAQEICELKTKEQRREALESVPAQFREWVALLVKAKFERKTTRRNANVHQAMQGR